MNNFTVLGTGWLGYSLAKELICDYKVKVSFRNNLKKEKLKKEGFIPLFLDEDNFANLDNLLDTDYLFINFPPSKSKDYLKFLNKIYENKNINNIKKIIFVSSTSIYPDMNRIMKEDYIVKESNSKIVFEAEKLIQSKTDIIFRCSGLMGDDRIPGKYFANKEIDTQDIKVNYVHRDDVIRATKFVIKNDLSGIFNLSSKYHPTRKEVYEKNSLKFGFLKPIFKKGRSYKNKIIDGSKIESLGFEYKFPNPLNYFD